MADHTAREPLARFRVAGINADFLLPGDAADAADARGTLQKYVTELLSRDCFPGEEHFLEALLAGGVEPVAVSRDEPAVGISLAAPRKLEQGHLNRFLSPLIAGGVRPVVLLPMADVLLPADRQRRARVVAAMAATLDGLIGAGGDGVDPAFYGRPNRSARVTNLARDLFEADLTLALLLQGRAFLLDICRSHQLVNVLGGAKLVQDLKGEGRAHVGHLQTECGLPRDAPAMIVRDDQNAVVFEHRVFFDRSSRIAAIVSADSTVTNSRHHQAVDCPSPLLKVVGLVHDDVTGYDTIEACEAWNVLSCQWHPEDMVQDPAALRLMQTVCRRARVLHHVKRCEDAATPLTGVQLQSWMLAAPQGDGREFAPSDFRWVRQDLAPRLQPPQVTAG